MHACSGDYVTASAADLDNTTLATLAEKIDDGTINVFHALNMVKKENCALHNHEKELEEKEVEVSQV